MRNSCCICNHHCILGRRCLIMKDKNMRCQQMAIWYSVTLSPPFSSLPFSSPPFPSLPLPSLLFPSLPFSSPPFPSLPLPSLPLPFLLFPPLSSLPFPSLCFHNVCQLKWLLHILNFTYGKSVAFFSLSKGVKTFSFFCRPTKYDEPKPWALTSPRNK